METLMKRHYHIKGTPTADNADWHTTDNYIEADVYYTKGGYSYFTYKNTPRGYFMSVVRMGKYNLGDGNIMEAHTLSSSGNGMKRMIKEVARQSKKGNAEAIEVYERDIDEFIKSVFPDLELELEE